MRSSSQCRFSLVALTTVAVAAVLSPLASSAWLGSVRSVTDSPAELQTVSKQRAIELRRSVHLRQRAHKDAVDACVDERARTGEDITCPDINDPSTYRNSLRALTSDTTATRSRAPSLASKLNALTARDRAIVEQAAARGDCTLGLAGRGLYRLCQQMVREQGGVDTAAAAGFLNDRAARALQEASARSQSLRARIEQTRGVLEHSAAPEQSSGHYRAR